MLGSSRAPKQYSVPNVINAMLGRDAVSRRRQPFTHNFTKAKAHWAVSNPDEDQWQTQVDEWLFQYIGQHAGAGMDTNIMQVLPSFDGLDPTELWDNVRIAGLSVQSVPYKVNGRIAVKMSGTARIQNTGKESIRAGQQIELYVMDDTESSAWKSTDPRKRIVPGIRPVAYGNAHIANLIRTKAPIPNSKEGNKILDEIKKLTSSDPNYATDYVALTEKLRHYYQPHIVGTAIQAARPKQYFEIMLALQTPG
jgi:hypothetical protein